jgi:ABC-type transport system involved in multi-copper enzyme maturation permease subunit
MQDKEADMLWNLYLNENTKLFRRALYWVGLAVLLGMGMAIFGFFYAAVQIPALSETLPPEQIVMFKGMLTWPAAFYTALQLSWSSIGVGGLLAFLLVGVVMAQEYPWRTVNLTVGHGTPRALVLAAKLLSIFTALAGWMVILILAVGAFTAFTTWQMGGSLDLGSVNLGHLGMSILRQLLALTPYVALTFCLAVATRSAVAAIGVVAGASLIGEPLFVQLNMVTGGGLSGVTAYLPMMLSQTLLKANESGAAGMIGAGGGMNPGTAAAAIAVYTGVFLLSAFVIFRRQDLSS